MTQSTLRYRSAARSHGMSERMAEAYAEIWQKLGITHELTINPGLHARSIREDELNQLMRRLIRKATCKLRNVPRRQMMKVGGRDPDVLMVAGFLERRTRMGADQPHWHGGVALRDGEEKEFRDLLWKHVGMDAANPLKQFQAGRTTDPLLRLPGAKPTFHLQSLKTPSRFIRYSAKQTIDADYDFSDTTHYLPY